jgi:hypothetical protein
MARVSRELAPQPPKSEKRPLPSQKSRKNKKETTNPKKIVKNQKENLCSHTKRVYGIDFIP